MQLEAKTDDKIEFYEIIGNFLLQRKQRGYCEEILMEEQIVSTRAQISEYTYEFNMQNDLGIRQIVKSEEHFNYWKAVYPFYKNVNQEGIKIYEQRDE